LPLVAGFDEHARKGPCGLSVVGISPRVGMKYHVMLHGHAAQKPTFGSPGPALGSRTGVSLCDMVRRALLPGDPGEDPHGRGGS
jgi:hypothetical protein